MKNQYQHTIPEGYKKTKMGIIPNEWGEDFLENVAEIRGRIGWKGLKREEYTKEGPYLIAGKHIKSPHVLWEQCDHISIERYEESMEIALKVNDIIFTKDGSLGNPAYIDYLPGKATINSTMMLVRANNEKINPRFLYHILNGKQFDQLVKEKTSGSSIPHLFQRDMKKFKVQLPTLQEQGKIASILSTWDKAIELKEKLIEQKKQQKKGLMQKLLTGEVRLPGFEDKWNKALLGDVCTITTGNKDTQNKVEGGKYPFFVRSQTVERIDTYSFDGEAILTAGDGVGVGKVFHYINGKFDFHQRVYKLSNFKGINGYFLYCYFSQNFMRQIRKYNAKTSVDSVRMEMLTGMEVPLPPITEQNTIAEFFKTVEKEIELLEKEVNLLKRQKKGLMQLLLTGKVRVQV
ncbi:restriction endonuclease subunit S [Heyndrickxia coagulans]|uniref:restriction endonuclease subunit S n=1 Tax=Heyndrickxia coagulans TaxID=1398 RepID=UPI002EB5B674|nr:restriction endonuclease subunit S [Heyndrickxia coagulans]